MKFLNLVIIPQKKFDRTLTDISQGSFRLGKLIGAAGVADGSKVLIISRHARNEVEEILKGEGM